MERITVAVAILESTMRSWVSWQSKDTDSGSWRRSWTCKRKPR